MDVMSDVAEIRAYIEKLDTRRYGLSDLSKAIPGYKFLEIFDALTSGYHYMSKTDINREEFIFQKVLKMEFPEGSVRITVTEDESCYIDDEEKTYLTYPELMKFYGSSLALCVTESGEIQYGFLGNRNERQTLNPTGSFISVNKDDDGYFKELLRDREVVDRILNS